MLYARGAMLCSENVEMPVLVLAADLPVLLHCHYIERSEFERRGAANGEHEVSISLRKLGEIHRLLCIPPPALQPATYPKLRASSRESPRGSWNHRPRGPPPTS
ncbi:hypothetical protein KQX54_005545 [Cotesia glomerata]|uniref:Uncharacterized protein n=1 Tax=Cotesia glomerata TaxID=32391 RepID=A0AAV7I4S8_COTGL|nr:hypothetical protein KQX54_005545 [Cotesia glomerata]